MQGGPTTQGSLAIARELFDRAYREQTAGRLEAAEALYRQVLAAEPRHANSLYLLGVIAQRTGRLVLAAELTGQAIAIDDGAALYHCNLGNVLRELRRAAEALASYERAVGLQAEYAEAWNNRGNALKDLQRLEEALASYRRAVEVRPDYAEALANQALVLGELDRAAEALAAYDRVLAIRPDHSEVFLNKALLLADLGQLERANQAVEAAIRLSPGRARYYYHWAMSRTVANGDACFQALKVLARGVGRLGVEEQVFLHFALGKAYGDVGDQAASFGHFLDGNALKRTQIVYNEAATLGGFATMRSAFPGELMRRLGGRGEASAVPVFILGMPRSGSTLVEQILASHPQVFGAGEIDDFEKSVARLRERGAGGEAFSLSEAQVRWLGADYVARIGGLAPGAARITNKKPENFRFVGFIHLALPRARIIHTRRDPVDTCLSCFSNLFRNLPYTYDLGELGRYYRGYAAMMRHWAEVVPEGVMLDVQYEDLVGDLEGQARRIVAHCGLEWDARCLDFHRTERVVRTASKSQVRQPIYTSSVGRWAAVEPLIGALLAELGISTSANR